MKNTIKGNCPYIRKFIDEGVTLGHTPHGTTYRIVYFDDLNRCYVYRMPTSHYNRKFRPGWTSVGQFKII